VRAPIAITGLGAVSAAGADVRALADSLKHARTGIRALTRFELVETPRVPVGQVEVLPGSEAEGSSTHRLAIAAAKEAVAGFDAERLAVIAGTTTGGVELSSAWYLEHKKSGAASPDRLRFHPASTVAGAVANAIGARGLRQTISTACSSGANAIITGADLLHTGAADAVLAGGADGLCLLTYLGFSCLRLISPAPCRPFDKDRDGLTLGEAGAFVLLERLEDAERRGAKIHALFLGGTITCDAHHMTAPAPSGDAVVRAIERSLADAGLAKRDVAYINAHGTSTPANDQAEARALRRVFGDKIPPTSSSKSFLGHTLGAAGAIEAVISVLAVRDGFLPPTLSTRTPEEGAPDDLVLGEARAADVPYAISSSFGFGGNNAVLVFARR
jgi:3-oxoacyl-(acyl-carrier-protein) synthase